MAGFIIMVVMAAVCFILSCRQFMEKGFLFNNAYIYASKEEREVMDKKPHYKQSGIIFLLLGIVCLMNAVDILFPTGFLFYAKLAVLAVTVIYAIISSVVIEKGKRGKVRKGTM